VIQAKRLTRRFGSQVAVEDVSFEVGAAEIVALLGPNGAGKTTTLRMLAGLLAPTSGAITIDGVQLTRRTGAVIRSKIGFLPEAPGLWERLTVRENLVVYAGLYGLHEAEKTIERLLDIFGLGSHADARAAELSKGMRQKTAIARALLHAPRILLLDEPTSGLDPEVIQSMRRLLDERRSAGCAIVLSTHNLDEASRLADRVAVIQKRLVALDSPDSLRRRLTTGRIIIVRLSRDSAAYVDTIRRFDVTAALDNGVVAVRLGDPNADTPGLVRALVEVGAEILEVRQEVPALEDVYMHLVRGEPTLESGRS
jgi:ABC-2 type transport system ATP-binding protein